MRSLGLSETSNDSDYNDYLSSPGSVHEDPVDLISAGIEDGVVAQLATAGPVGVAAAAAIVSTKQNKENHHFETNPTIRKRQETRLLRKLKKTIYEFTSKIGKQAIVLVVTPGKPKNSYKVFGAKPLEDIIKDLRPLVMNQLENVLDQQLPSPVQDDPELFELPLLKADGIPTPIEKMTQAQLRAFIPLMLKYSTGRGKPGWGRDDTRPAWWPKEIPWSNVRMDVRTKAEKQNVPWTDALRQIILSCYKYHGREDLLPIYTEEDEMANANISNAVEKIENHSSNMITVEYNPTDLGATTGPDNIVAIPKDSIITFPDRITAHPQEIEVAIKDNVDEEADADHFSTIQSADEGVSGIPENIIPVIEGVINLNSEGQPIVVGENGCVSRVVAIMGNIQYLQTNNGNVVYLIPKLEPNNEDGDMETEIACDLTTYPLMIQSSTSTDAIT